MSPVTLPSSRTLLLCACAERPRPSYSFFFFRFSCQPEMPPDAGHGKRESAPATIPGCHVWQDHFQTDAAGGTPATASHARMTMTVTGLPSRRQESEAFPCQLRRPFDFPVARCAISHTSPFSFPSLQVYANVPMPPFQTASVVIFVAGAKVKTGLGTQIF